MADPEPIDAVVLVADDDDLVRSVLGMALRSLGLTVVEAADARQVAEVARNAPLDLAVLDINMPGGTVHDTLGSLREEQPALRVLVLSGDLSPPADLHTVANDFAHKPIELPDFLSRVTRLLRQSQHE